MTPLRFLFSLTFNTIAECFCLKNVSKDAGKNYPSIHSFGALKANGKKIKVHAQKVIMKNIYLLILTSLTSITLHSNNNIELAVSGAQQTQMPLAILVLDKTNAELNTIANTIKKDLAFTDQFAPFIKQCSAQISPKELGKIIQKLGNAGTPLALCINAQSPDHIEWRLYDTLQCTMLQGKKYTKRGTVSRGWAHAIADTTWKTLTGNAGFFSSRLAYCKDTKDDKGGTIRKIYVADYDGSNEELLVDANSITIAPRWHKKKAHLCYSQYTDTNVSLVTTSMAKKKKPISDLDGINMLASFADNDKDYVYCASKGNGSCQIYINKNGTLKRCTKNTGNNTSPLFMDTERIVFCSDFQTGNPQIYIGNLTNGHLQRITKGGYCTSPAYCPSTNTIAYHKMIRGTMQIMLYDCSTKNHSQFTDDGGNKHEVSWSPDGTHLLYSHELTYDKSRLAISNALTHKRKYVSRDDVYCSYPNWSPHYPKFPVVT